MIRKILIIPFALFFLNSCVSRETKNSEEKFNLANGFGRFPSQDQNFKPLSAQMRIKNNIDFQKSQMQTDDFGERIFFREFRVNQDWNANLDQLQKQNFRCSLSSPAKPSDTIGVRLDGDQVVQGSYSADQSKIIFIARDTRDYSIHCYKIFNGTRLPEIPTSELISDTMADYIEFLELPIIPTATE